MAEVYRARDRLLEDAVAIKVVRADVVSTPEFSQRFQREVATSAGVVHPHLVPVHDLGRLPDGRPYLALALADGGSLLELRRRNPPWPVLARLLDETLSALSCLHARGILHLDVKLSNVLLHRDGGGVLRAWLSDMGLARALANQEAFQGTLAGTLSYMPLELLLRRYPEIGPTADLFAVGVLVYRLVSGTNPFKADGVPAHIDLRYRPPARLPVRPGLSVPPGLEDLVLTLLQPDPRSRFDLAADLRAALAALPPAPDVDPAGPEVGEPGDRGLAPATDVVLLDAPPGMEVDPLSMGHDGPPPWHRPALGPFPFRPPPEPGRGARARASLPLFALREIPLVGREVERQRLWDRAREVATTGRPAVVILRGEAGVGKSRLAGALRRALEECGRAVAVEISFSQAGGPGDGYGGAVRRLLRLVGEAEPRYVRARLERWLARDTRQRPADVALEAGLLQRWGAPDPEDAPVPASVAREFVLRHLVRYAWRGLGLLMIEDAHWCTAGDDGAALASSVLQMGLPVLAVVTTRDDPLQLRPQAASDLEALVALGAEVMTLHRIPAEEMGGLVDEYLPLAPALTAEVVRLSEGNPLFARELIGQWCRDEALRVDPGVAGGPVRFCLATPRASCIPEDIRALLAARLSSLLMSAPGAAAQVGRALDVVGVAESGTPWAVLAEAAGAGLEVLVEGRLIHRRGEVVVPDHPLLAQLLRERVQGRALVSAHLALAEAWARAGSGPTRHLHAGRHHLAADQRDQAVEPLSRAVRHLLVGGSAGDLRSAAQELDGACRGRGLEDPAWLLAQLALSEADRAMGSRRHALARIEALLARQPIGAAAVEVAAAYVETLDYQDRARLGLPALEAAEAQLREAPPGTRARFHQARATCLLHLARHGPAERAVRLALEVVVEAPHRAELLFQLGKCREAEDPEAALEVLAEARQRAEAVGYRSLVAQVLAVMARLHGVRGQWERGEAMAEEAERVALGIGFHAHVPLCRNAWAECLRFRGDVEGAEALYTEGRGWAAATGQRAWTFVFDLNLALCALVRGDLPGLRERLDAIAREADPHWEPFAPAVAGLNAVCALRGGGGAEAMRGVPLRRLVAEGLDGVFIATALADALVAAGLDEEAARLRGLAQDSLARKRLSPSLLVPMLAAHARGLGALPLPWPR